MSKTISRQSIEHKLLLGENIKLVEALPAQYFEQGHLPGAVNMPLNAIDSVASRKLDNKDELIAVYCADTSCQNSHKAAQALRNLGYTNVQEYVEGKADWKQAGLPLE